MKRSMKEWVLRVAILMLGLCIAHLGVTLFLLSDLGSDPFNVFVQGLYRSVDKLTGWGFLTHGRVHVAISLVIVAVLLFVDRRYIKIGTALCMLFGGPIIDVFNALLEGPTAGASLPVRVCMLVAGCVILAYGMTIVIRSDAGTGPNDLVAVVISDKTKRKFSVPRVAVDACFLVIGFLLGGTAGVGTLVCMLSLKKRSSASAENAFLSVCRMTGAYCFASESSGALESACQRCQI